MSDGDVGIVVVNFGNPELLQTNLVRTAEDSPDAHVIVVDNHSTDANARAVAALCDVRGWTAVLSPTNDGFGKGSNRGAAEALEQGCDVLVFLNPDASIDADSMRMLVDAVHRHPADLVGPRIVGPDGRVWSAGVDLDLANGDMRRWSLRDGGAAPHTLPWITGACFAISAELWATLGGFDEDYFLYWEDVDLSARVAEAGGEVRVVEQATAVHDEGSTHRALGETRAKSATYYYFNIRNRLVFAAKHLDRSDRRRWRRSAVPAAYAILLRGGRRQFLHPYAPLKAAARGTVDGLRYRPTS